MKSPKFLIRRKSDGWYVSPGSNHTALPDRAIVLEQSELDEWLKTWGSGYEAIKKSEAKEVIE